MAPTNEDIETPRPQHSLISALSRPIVILLALQLLGGMLLSPQRTFFPLYIAEGVLPKDRGQPVLILSVLVTAQQIMGLLGAWFGGALSDALGRKPALLLGQMGAVLASLSFIYPSLAWIAPLWVLSGFCGGMQTVSSQSYLIDAAPAAYLGLFSAFYNWGFTLGGASGSPLAGWLLTRSALSQSRDFRLLGIVAASMAILALALNMLLLPAMRGSAHPSARRSLASYRDIATRPSALLLAMLRFLPTFYWGMATLLIPLLLSASGAGVTTIALYATISQVCAAAAQLTVGRAADRLGCRGTTLVTFAMLVVSILGLGLFYGRTESIFILGTTSTMAAWSLSTLMPSLVALRTAPAERGRVLGWVHLWWNLGMIVGSMAGGVLYRAWPGLPFLVGSAAVAVALGLALLFFRGWNSSAGKEE